MDKLKKYSAPFLRISLSLVFFWFAVNQLIDSSAWSGYVPQWIVDFGINADTLVKMNAIFEIIFGGLLLIGVWVRAAALLLALHLLGITMSLGYGTSAIRDFGLTLATFAIFLQGSDQLCLKK